MRRSVMVAGNPWTVVITLEEDPDSLGCTVSVQELTIDGETADAYELTYETVEEALREMEMSYGVGPDDWLTLD